MCSSLTTHRLDARGRNHFELCARSPRPSYSHEARTPPALSRLSPPRTSQDVMVPAVAAPLPPFPLLFCFRDGCDEPPLQAGGSPSSLISVYVSHVCLCVPPHPPHVCYCGPPGQAGSPLNCPTRRPRPVLASFLDGCTCPCVWQVNRTKTLQTIQRRRYHTSSQTVVRVPRVRFARFCGLVMTVPSPGAASPAAVRCRFHVRVFAASQPRHVCARSQRLPCLSNLTMRTHHRSAPSLLAGGISCLAPILPPPIRPVRLRLAARHRPPGPACLSRPLRPCLPLPTGAAFLVLEEACVTDSPGVLRQNARPLVCCIRLPCALCRQCVCCRVLER